MAIIPPMQSTPPSLFKGQFLHFGFLSGAIPLLLACAKPSSIDW
jgi:hypothetical protein